MVHSGQGSAARVTARDEQRRRLVEALDGVRGYLHVEEAWQLHEAARRASERSAAFIVEIGALEGRSAISLALGTLASGTGSTVLSVDPNRNKNFAPNLERAGVLAVVRTVDRRSHDARPLVGDGSVDVLFVDGLHTYEGVLQDIDDWAPTLVAGAIVAFNDVGFPNVQRALRERVVKTGSRYRNPYLAENTLFFDYVDASAPWTHADEVALSRLRRALRAKLVLHTARAKVIALAPGLKSMTRRIAPAITKVVTRPFLPGGHDEQLPRR
jgi:predicted O-methyltransferase YrrM